jgi:probable HAF family extracellular repeat protein
MSCKRAITLGCLSLTLLACEEARNPASISESPSSSSVLASAPVGVPVYNVTAIDATLGLRLNQSGDVVGWTTRNGPTQPILYTAQTGAIVLPTSTSQPYGVARDLSDRVSGVITVVGEARLNGTGSAIHAVRWRVGVPLGTVLSTTDLGTLPGDFESAANGVNNAGQIVGTSDPNSSLSIRSFIRSGAAGMVDLGLGGVGTTARALDLNGTGVVTGYLGLRAFRWTVGGGLEDLGVPAGWPNSFGNAINASGQVAGSATNGTGNASRVIRYTNGIGWQILGGMGFSNNAGPNSGNGINQWGDVVGLGFPRTGSTAPSMRGVFFSDNLGVLAYIDDLLLSPGSWTVLRGFDINDAQQITGNAHNPQTGVTTAVLLTPVALPPANQPPIARFSYSCNVFFTCALDGSSSTDDRAIVWWSWSVNGQVVATEKYTSLQLSGPQTINLTLTVTDTRGATNAITKPVVVGGANSPPVASFKVTCSPGKCVLDASTSTDDKGIVSFDWKPSVANRPVKSGVQITRSWLASGPNTYQETLTVTDGGGLTSSVTRQITIPHP